MHDHGGVQREHRAAFAVVRVDEYLPPKTAITDRISVKEIVSTLDEAEREVARLNELNADKGCLYFWQHTSVLEPAERPT
jgi:hypothetical protein